jgi:hypothetical protein
VADVVVAVRVVPLLPHPAAIADTQTSPIAPIRLSVIVVPDGFRERNLPDRRPCSHFYAMGEASKRFAPCASFPF